MPKRKLFTESDEDEEEYIDIEPETKKTKKTKKSRPIIKFEDCPQVNSLKDLIDIGNKKKFYKNIDIMMLWNILPHLEELNNMIGMKSLKESIFYQVIYYLQNMHLKNKNEEYLHTIIMGNPGSGKTTVAKIIGLIYKNIGILSTKGSFKIAGRADLVGEYLGSTAVKTTKLLNSCIGGVLFIDEVYSLGAGQKDKDSFSKEAVDTLCGFLSEHKNDFCCIVAGYEKEVKECFLSINPGLERRFPWVHKIDDYTNEDLAEIFIKMIADIKWELNIEKKDLVEFFKTNKEYFKNAGGDCETFISKIKMVHSKRVFTLDKSFKFKININDVTEALNIIKKYKVNTEKTFLDYYT
jgi:SpoVK/Ycf46/Vps4 family AAA+-type ATPase